MSDDSHIRWQQELMGQFGSALNLVLGLTVSSIGYWFFLLTDAEFKPKKWGQTPNFAY